MRIYFFVNERGKTVGLDEYGAAIELYERPYGKVAHMEYLGWKEVKTAEELETPAEVLRQENLPKDKPPRNVLPIRRRLNKQEVYGPKAG